MLQPVGPLPSGIYWRRRLITLAGVLLLLFVVYLILPHGGDSNASPPPSTTPSATGTGSAPSPTSTAPATKAPAKKTTTPKKTPTSTPPKPCALVNLKIEAITSANTYAAGQQPTLSLRVTNMAKTACVQDLGDAQIELRVYSGESRVWGSHDCTVAPGVDQQTLLPARPVIRSVTWSGRSSQPGCAGDRQQVGVGNYTLYALLAEEQGTATQFAIA